MIIISNMTGDKPVKTYDTSETSTQNISEVPSNKPAAATDEWRQASLMWQWYEDAKERGHKDWIQIARKNERYYLGGGGQWSEADKAFLENVAKTVPIEINAVLPAINVVIGEQIFTRVDISFRPKKEPANQQTAEILRKLCLHIKDNNNLPNIETQVFSDGVIQQRGYYDIRVDFNENMQGEITIEAVDPLDVIPDPNAQSYDVKDWQRVQRTRWLSYNEIEELYGVEARKKVENSRVLEDSWGSDGTSPDDAEGRNAFGSVTSAKYNKYYDAYLEEGSLKKVRVIETQWRKFKQENFFVAPSGDMRLIPQNLPQEQIQHHIQTQGYQIINKISKRIRWTISTRNAILHDDWSPYSEFTIVPFFPIFRRGKTLGLVDNTISSQDLLNGSVTAMLQITKSTANSGWQVEEDSIIRPESIDELEDVGRKTGLVIEYKKGATPPQKTQANSIPTGIDRLLQYGEKFTRDTIGVSEAEQGQQSQEVSGVAIQTKVFQGKLQRAGIMDNLALTRKLLATRMLELIQQFYTEQRILKIAGKNDMGQQTEDVFAINQITPEGQIINDVTLGEYEVVIDAIPTSASFEAQAFQQALELRKIGIAIPDGEIIRYANFTNKAEVIQSLQKKSDPMADAKVKEIEAKVAKMMAEVENIKAQAGKFIAEKTVKSVESQFAATHAAQIIVQSPGIAPVADELLKSAGYVDHNEPPIIPTPQGIAAGQPIPEQQNTSPLFPPRPESAVTGAMAGIEGGQEG